jgi:hypothetical protein
LSVFLQAKIIVNCLKISCLNNLILKKRLFQGELDNFNDPGLYNDPTVFQVDDDVIDSQIEQGFLSINNRQGKEAYYCDIEKENRGRDY